MVGKSCDPDAVSLKEGSNEISPSDITHLKATHVIAVERRLGSNYTSPSLESSSLDGC